MSREEILALSPEALFAAVREKLFPWDETRCRLCGWPLRGEIEDGCTADSCSMRYERNPPPPADSLPDLSGWSGAGRMRQAMIERGWSFEINQSDLGCRVEFYGDRGGHEGHGLDGDEQLAIAVARACLLALENQP